ncbi:MAG: transporter substrate-binding domain-containing protein, partial [Acidimicrobiia bacterium]|nr:transporter substrate-binding domain-containing protein [Acidimicrobiia bacterium]
TITNEGDLGYDEYVPFAGAAEAFTGLKQGRVDVLTSDSVLASFNANEDAELAVTGPTINAHPLSMTFRQESQPLIDAINPILDEMIADGTLAEIQLKWFGRCIAVPDTIDSQPPYDQLPAGC